MSRPITRRPAGLLALVLLCASGIAAAGDPRGFTAEDLVGLDRISDPRPAPDGGSVVFVRRATDREANRGRTDLWRVGIDGSDLRPLTRHEAADSSPRWRRDGSEIFFLSSRSGSSQVWAIRPDGGEARQVTDLPLAVSNLALSPVSDHMAFTLTVEPGCEDLACTKSALDAEAASPRSGRLYDRLFVRHWDTLEDGRRSHLFVTGLDGGSPVDVTAGLDADVPSQPFGGPEEFAFTPDGRGIVFVAREATSDQAWSTDFDLYHAPLDGSSPPRVLTEGNPAWDTGPVFSPDGGTLAYLAMRRPGFESDRLRIVLREWPGGGERVLAEAWDRSPHGLFFSPDGATLYAAAGDVGEVKLFAVDVSSGGVTRILDGGHVRSASLAGDRIVFGLDHLSAPVDLYTAARDGSDRRRLTEVNAERLADVRFGEVEQFSFPGWNDETVHGYLVKPWDFAEGRRYPLAFLIHGGPQGSFDNDFHYRWNPQVYSGAGYAAVMIDFHGSTGYGQTFTDSITGDWGGKPLEDLRKGLAAVLARHGWIDGDRACALGASYGGYMVNWIAGNWPDGFRCLVNHDGVFDNRMMYYATEELWFPEWEHGGPYWAHPQGHEKHNPARFVQNWETPMLVIHGALDYRVPETQGLAAFTALQRRGIPSRFLYFPDESHWVLQPANSVQWHEVVLDWLERWLKGKPE
ncbi:MAG: S9 family peptidase [Thermoanaerobaculia bacterium]|nr:S9 family peptidase [Thermoanaerobaculia bacterium]